MNKSVIVSCWTRLWEGPREWCQQWHLWWLQEDPGRRAHCECVGRSYIRLVVISVS